MPNLLRRFQYWINFRTRASDLAEEIEAHRAMTQEKLEQSGIPAGEARYASRRVLGNALYLVERSHNGLIYGVTTTDPVTLGCTCGAIAGVTGIAGIVPARRAMRVDPIVALKCE